eukprot:3311950-Amphidinium_carterae.1
MGFFVILASTLQTHTHTHLSIVDNAASSAWVDVHFAHACASHALRCARHASHIVRSTGAHCAATAALIRRSWGRTCYAIVPNTPQNNN